MTTSFTLSKTAGKLVEQALRKARIIPAEQPVQPIDYERGLESLNNIVKFLQTEGVPLWNIQRAVLPLDKSESKYLLGPSGAPCGTEDTFYSTSLTVANIATDTVLTVPTTGMVAAPNILSSDPTDSTQDWDTTNATLAISSGLRVSNDSASAGYAEYTLDVTAGQTYVFRYSYTLGTSVSGVFSVLNGTTIEDTSTLTASATDQELTITANTGTIVFRAGNGSTTGSEYSTVYDLNYVDTETGSRIGIELDDETRQWTHVLNVDSATSCDIVSGLTGAAAINNTVHHFSEQIQRPLEIDNTNYGSNFTASEIPVDVWARQEYMEQTDKSSKGTVNGAYYNPTLTNGELYVWQTASNVKNVLRFDVLEPLKSYSATTDTLDVAEEYYQALLWGVAADIGPEYGVKQDRQMVLEGKAGAALDKALDNDSEMGSIYFGIGD